MSYKNGNYCAFYVDEPFSDSNLTAHSTRDFVYYQMLKAWKGKDNNFPFNNSHDKTYNVRDGSNWESTLKPRLRERLNNSKNIILFLSSITKSSRALDEEINYGVNTLGLPIIVIYPEYDTKQSILTSNGSLKQEIKNLWNNLPIFRDSARKVPVLHIPISKDLIQLGLKNEGFMVNTKKEQGEYAYRN